MLDLRWASVKHNTLRMAVGVVSERLVVGTIGSAGDGHHEGQFVTVRQRPPVALPDQGVVDVGAVGAEQTSISVSWHLIPLLPGLLG